MEINLTDLSIGKCGYVSSILGNTATKNAIKSAGFLIGNKVVMLRMSPYKKTYLIDIAGQVKTIRKPAASLVNILVKREK